MLTEVYITGRFAFKFKRELSIDHLLELGLLALLVPQNRRAQPNILDMTLITSKKENKNA